MLHVDCIKAVDEDDDMEKEEGLEWRSDDELQSVRCVGVSRVESAHKRNRLSRTGTTAKRYSSLSLCVTL